jgi:hypothetical protein
MSFQGLPVRQRQLIGSRIQQVGHIRHTEAGDEGSQEAAVARRAVEQTLCEILLCDILTLGVGLHLRLLLLLVLLLLVLLLLILLLLVRHCFGIRSYAMVEWMMMIAVVSRQDSMVGTRMAKELGTRDW